MTTYQHQRWTHSRTRGTSLRRLSYASVPVADHQQDWRSFCDLQRAPRSSQLVTLGRGFTAPVPFITIARHGALPLVEQLRQPRKGCGGRRADRCSSRADQPAFNSLRDLNSGALAFDPVDHLPCRDTDLPECQFTTSSLGHEQSEHSERQNGPFPNHKREFPSKKGACRERG